MKWRNIALPTIAFGSLLYLILPHKEEVYSDATVKAGILQIPIKGFFAHLSDDSYLTIHNKTYKHVRGSKPYYLHVPEIDSILFVTGAYGKKGQFHIFNLGTKREMVIDGVRWDFGNQIGSKSKPGEPFTDYIESASSNQLVATTRSLKFKYTMFLNLESKKIERFEEWSYDNNGNVTNHVLEPN